MIDEQFPSPVKAFNLYNLALLQGRYMESEGKFEEAAKTYLSVLNFAHHMAMDSLPGSKAVAAAAEKFSLKPLRVLVNDKKLQRQMLSQIRNFLENYRPQSFSKTDILTAVKEETKSTFHLMADTFVIMFTNVYRDDPGSYPDDILQWAAAFRGEFVRLSTEELDYLYGDFIRAVETDRSDDWDYARKASEKRRKAAEKLKAQNPELESEPSTSCFVEYRENRSNACIKDLITFMIAGSVSFPESMFNSVDKSLVEINAIKKSIVEQLTQ